MIEAIRLISAILWLWSADPGPGAIAEIGIASEKDKAAHRYHGILVSHEDKTGSYFYRDGERCQLYTKAFLRGWDENTMGD